MISSVLIIGTGHAGFQAAASLREKGFAGSVTLIGDEHHLPYQRPPLSKGYLALSPPPEVLLRPEQFYRDNKIELRVDAHVAAIDRERRTATLESGETIPYDHLVLATGGRNRQLNLEGGDLEGVSTLRRLDDAQRLRRYLHAAGGIVIIGGGYIGLEVCSVALALGVEILIVEAATRLVARVASNPLSEFFLRHYEKAGARILRGATVARILGSAGRVESVQLSSGESVATSLVLLCVGIAPDVELAEAAGLETADGIVVDCFLRTSDASIFAIGDCARYPSRYAAGNLVRVESVPNAMDQGRAVAETILGRPRDFDSVPWFWSEQGKLRLQIAGLTQGHDRTVVKGDPESGVFSVFCFRNGTFAGVESMNRPVDFVAAKRALGDALPITAEEAANPAFDLKSRVGPVRPVS